VLSLSSISLAYRHRTVLDRVSLAFGVGTTALLGVNGAGKTTLLHAACGALRPSAGTVRIHGDDPYTRATRSQALARVALIPQFLDFPRHLKVSDFLHYMAMIRGVPPRERAAACRQALASVDLADRQRARLGTLSGGMLKRLSIAQALLTAPEVLLCDEPTVGLDPEQRATTRELLQQLAAERCLVIASHIVEDAHYLAQRVVVLHDQRVAYDGTPAGMLAPTRDDPQSSGSDLEQAFRRVIRGGSA
jgi:ABC-2 type transport system ATP-binding protein